MSSDFTPLQDDLPERTGTRALPRQTILVVEDDPLLCFTVADVLRNHGFTVLEARDAAAACALLQGEAIDLLFTDIELPGAMDGLALAEIASETRPGLKIIIASGHVRTENCPKIADVCFNKPYDFDRLVAVIRSLLSRGSASAGSSATRREPCVPEKAASIRSVTFVS